MSDLSHASRLNAEEARVLFEQCREHLVATCPGCRVSYTPQQLGRDLFVPGQPFICPRCQVDLTAAVRDHLVRCSSHT